jgi:cell division protein FtsB
MKKIATLLFLLLCGTGVTLAQSKKELEASIVQLNAKNDSLAKANNHNLSLLDSLQRLTGVKVQNLDTVKSVIASRKAASAACADSLAKTAKRGVALQHQVDSLTAQNGKLRTKVDSLTAALAPPPVDAAPAPTRGQTVSTGKTEQLMKLNGMLEQGLITKDEFLKLKAELMK